MLVATFGPASAWAGREIIWDVGRFIMVGHGAIPAADATNTHGLSPILCGAVRRRSDALTDAARHRLSSIMAANGRGTRLVRPGDM